MHVKDEIIDGETLSIYHIDNDYYEVYDENGNCLNEGEPLYDCPTVELIKELAQ